MNKAVNRSRQSGFGLLLVLMMASIVALMLYEALPRAVFEGQRFKEDLLIQRGEEYKRAIQLYLRKLGRYPGTIEQLEETNNIRFLRHRYVDPMTGKDEWRLIHVGPGGMFLDSLTQKAPQVQGINTSSIGSSQSGSGSSQSGSVFGTVGLRIWTNRLWIWQQSSAPDSQAPGLRRQTPTTPMPASLCLSDWTSAAVKAMAPEQVPRPAILRTTTCCRAWCNNNRNRSRFLKQTCPAEPRPRRRGFRPRNQVN